VLRWSIETYANVGRYKIGHREWIHKCPPVVEEYEQDAKAESVVGSEELSMSSIGVLLVVAIERAAIFECMVFCRCLDCMVEDDIGKADDAVADEL